MLVEMVNTTRFTRGVLRPELHVLPGQRIDDRSGSCALSIQFVCAACIILATRSRVIYLLRIMTAASGSRSHPGV